MSLRVPSLCGWLLGLLLGWSVVAGTNVVEAAPSTAEEREAIRELSVSLTKAGNLYKEGKFKESADVVKDVQGKVETLAASGKRDLLPLIDPLYGKLERAHALLELEGLELPVLKKPRDVAADAPAKPQPGAPGTGGVSFVKQVVPILMSKCGRCHVNDAKGMFSASNFENLMKGPRGNKVIFPGDADDSRLIETITSGDMPRGGLKVTAEELATLKKWIMEGAKFDGASATENLAALNPNAKPADAPKMEVARATGKETVSFAREIAPVLSAQCSSCHGAMRPRENFSLVNFDRLLKGGDGGPPIEPGKPAESLLFKKLMGTGGGARMPQGRPPLPTDVLAKIEKWIEEGAKFDGDEPTMELVRVAALAKARFATHEELTADRAKLAGENWRLGMPDGKPSTFESTNFLVLGNVGDNTLADIGERAEAVAPKVAALFKLPENQPLIKGRMTLFVFSERYDYSEFGQMVEKRQIPKEWRGHWLFDVVDSYGALVPPKANEYPIENLIAQQLAGAYIASLGKVPRWFSEGTARAAAAKLNSQDSRVTGWNEQLPAVLSSMQKPDDGIQGKLPPEVNDIANYSLATFLMNDAKRFSKLMDDLRSTGKFEESFSGAYGGSPNQVAEVWIKRVAAKGVRPPTKSGKK
ncbi:MAG: c-type cytochrome domain-containing protein [Planctomycetota bacterium]